MFTFTHDLIFGQNGLYPIRAIEHFLLGQNIFVLIGVEALIVGFLFAAIDCRRAPEARAIGWGIILVLGLLCYPLIAWNILARYEASVASLSLIFVWFGWLPGSLISYLICRWLMGGFPRKASA